MAATNSRCEASSLSANAKVFSMMSVVLGSWSAKGSGGRSGIRFLLASAQVRTALTTASWPCLTVSSTWSSRPVNMSVAVAMGGSPCNSCDVLVCACCKEYYPVAWYVKHACPEIFLAEDVLPRGVADRRVGSAAHRRGLALGARPFGDPGRPVLPPGTLVLGGFRQP